MTSHRHFVITSINMIDKSMFRAYDIRGIYPSQINRNSAMLIGEAFGKYMKKYHNVKHPRIIVGRDCRTHSHEIEIAFIKGVLSTNCDVTDVGMSPTPLLYFANTVDNFDGGCNITASHNPKEYNGFKLIYNNAHAVYGQDLQDIYYLTDNSDKPDKEGMFLRSDYSKKYIEKLTSLFKFQKTLKIVIDTANGVSGKLYPEILRSFGHEVIELFTEINGEFPNHEPDPIVEGNLTQLKKKVTDEKADIGVAFDGDGDRCAFVTEKAEMKTSDEILMLLAEDALKRNPGRAVIFTVSNSQTLFDLIKNWGGKPVMCKVGHSFVEAAMTANKAILGGEQSGHFFLPEGYFQYDDAMVAALRVLSILSASSKSFSDLFKSYPKTYSMPEARPFCPDDEKFKIIDKITVHFKDIYPSNTMDGIRIDFGNGGWAGIRASNTSPKISIIIEAQTSKHLDEIKGIVLGHMKSYPEIDWNK
jgi:phosphomannomutase/phosphoglucomutase